MLAQVADVVDAARREVVEDKTSSPRSRYASARCDPMNPAPPVISTRIVTVLEEIP